ncbi:hypothetical protein QCA50_001578 [Cerrena zonata]|uniref:Chromo domain-containing protein n=1 Tax=Cerrena zonata TaxID=2478898 RepID=A0AAW0GW58_9APHY
MAKKKKEEQFHVEVITKARIGDPKEYYVKWAGYKSDENSWEPEENVQTCDRLLRSFWRNFPEDNTDYPEGHVLHAPDAWIAQETDYFWKNYEGSIKREVSEDDSRSKRSRSRSKRRVKREASTASLRGESSKKVKKEPVSSSSDDENIAIAPRLKRARRPVAQVGSDSSDDMPLKKLPRMTSASGSVSTMASAKGKERAGTGAAKASISASALTSKASGSQAKPKRNDDTAESIRKSQNTVAANARSPSPNHSLFSEGSSPAQPLADLPPEPPKAQNPPARNVPAHRAPGKIKMMPFEAQNTAPGSTIVTKQRIALGSGPKPGAAPAQPPPPASVFPAKKPLLSQLSFKKKPKLPTEDNTSPQSPHIPSATSSTGGYEWGAARTGETSRLAGIRRLVESPAPMSPVQSDHDPSFREATPPSAGPSRQIDRARDPRLNALRRPSTTSVHLSSMMENAEKFLSDFMPAEMAAPMVEPTVTDDVPPVVPTYAPSISQAPKVIQPVQNPMASRIPKKWKWSGELYMDTNEDSATKLCNISLTEPTEPRPGGLRINLCLTSTDSLRFKKLHNVWDLSTMLQASEAVQQFCRVIPKESDDADPLKTLHTYMIKNELFTYAHIYLDHNPVALLIVFPSAHTTICNLLRSPRIITDDGGLVSALVPWSLASEQYQKSRWTKPRQLISTDYQLDPGFTDMFKAVTKQKLVTNPLLQHGLRLHKFPRRLFDSLFKKPYCIWFSPSDGPPNNPGYETATMKVILNTCSALDVGYKRDVNAMFIHVGALNTMYKVPAMANRRAKQPDLRFFTYGTHETVHQSRWGLREVYPLGGCVTFTPSVFLEDPIGIYQMIRKFDDHPLWSVFLPPNVIGVIAKLVSHGQDPLELYDSNNFVFAPLIEMIEKGRSRF